jgi:hypothetical protein
MSKAVRHALDSLGLIFARLPAQVGMEMDFDDGCHREQ